MSQPNPNTFAPSLPFPEVGKVVVDVQLADNPRRRGPRQAAEGLGDEPDYRNAFGQGAVFSRDGSSHETFDAIEAGQANGRGRLGSGQEVPAWNAVDAATRAGFWQGTDGTEQSVTVRPPRHAQRPGANSATITPLAAITAGERPGTTFGYSVAPPGGGRRRNQADVTEAL
jgi:hypothetical protein